MNLLDEISKLDTMTVEELQAADEHFLELSEYASRRVTSMRFRAQGEDKLAEGQEAVMEMVRESFAKLNADDVPQECSRCGVRLDDNSCFEPCPETGGFPHAWIHVCRLDHPNNAFKVDDAIMLRNGGARGLVVSVERKTTATIAVKWEDGHINEFTEQQLLQHAQRIDSATTK